MQAIQFSGFFGGVIPKKYPEGDPRETITKTEKVWDYSVIPFKEKERITQIENTPQDDLFEILKKYDALNPYYEIGENKDSNAPDTLSSKFYVKSIYDKKIKQELTEAFDIDWDPDPSFSTNYSSTLGLDCWFKFEEADKSWDQKKYHQTFRDKAKELFPRLFGVKPKWGW